MRALACEMPISDAHFPLGCFFLLLFFETESHTSQADLKFLM